MSLRSLSCLVSTFLRPSIKVEVRTMVFVFLLQTSSYFVGVPAIKRVMQHPKQPNTANKTNSKNEYSLGITNVAIMKVTIVIICNMTSVNIMFGVSLL